MLLIGLGFKMRQGKNTFANYVQELMPEYKVKQYSFAELLKLEVNRLYEQFGDWSKTFCHIHHNIQEMPNWVTIENSPDMTDPLCPYGKQRTLLQWYGSEYRRAQSKNYWVKALAKTIETDKDSIDIGLITDLRFPNELHWIKSFGRDGLTVKVEREGFTGNVDHQSETILDGYDFDFVVKAASLDELKNDAVEFVKIIKERNNLPEEFKNWEVGE